MGLEATAAAASLSTSISSLCAHTHTHQSTHRQIQSDTNSQKRRLAAKTCNRLYKQMTSCTQAAGAEISQQADGRWCDQLIWSLSAPSQAQRRNKQTHGGKKKKTPNVPHKGRVSFAANIWGVFAFSANVLWMLEEHHRRAFWGRSDSCHNGGSHQMPSCLKNACSEIRIHAHAPSAII